MVGQVAMLDLGGEVSCWLRGIELFGARTHQSVANAADWFSENLSHGDSIYNNSVLLKTSRAKLGCFQSS